MRNSKWTQIYMGSAAGVKGLRHFIRMIPDFLDTEAAGFSHGIALGHMHFDSEEVANKVADDFDKFFDAMFEAMEDDYREKLLERQAKAAEDGAALAEFIESVAKVHNYDVREHLKILDALIVSAASSLEATSASTEAADERVGSISYPTTHGDLARIAPEALWNRWVDGKAFPSAKEAFLAARAIPFAPAADGALNNSDHT